MNYRKNKFGALLAASALLTTLSTESNAALITTITGSFTGMTGGNSAYYVGEGTNQIFWGDTSGGLDQSSVEFLGYTYGGTSMGALSALPNLPYSDPAANPIQLGSLVLHNGVTLFGSEITQAMLNLTIQQYDDVAMSTTYSNLDTALSMITTTLNTGDPVLDRDQLCVTVSSSGSVLCANADEGGTISVIPVAILGSIYIVDFIPTTQGGTVTLTDANGAIRTTYIDSNGAMVTTYVPEPSPLSLMLIGVALIVFSVRKKIRSK